MKIIVILIVFIVVLIGVSIVVTNKNTEMYEDRLPECKRSCFELYNTTSAYYESAGFFQQCTCYVYEGYGNFSRVKSKHVLKYNSKENLI